MSPLCFPVETTQGPQGRFSRARIELWLSEEASISAWAEHGVTQNPPACSQMPVEGECHLGNYFKFISAIRCNCIHMAGIFVLVKLSLA